MSPAAEKFNLRTGEKRLLVGIGIVLFVVLNVLFVWPRFGEFGRVRAETRKIRSEIAKFQAEIDREDRYREQLREMEGQGSRIVREEQALLLLQTVQSQALASGVTVNRYQESGRGLNVATNAFFDEQSLLVSYDTDYPELINFLVVLAEHESMIRVRQMDVKPSPNRQRLQGNITLVASYQKTRPGPSSTSTASNP
jgi:Tfp pilus assembly protein PilO